MRKNNTTIKEERREEKRKKSLVVLKRPLNCMINRDITNSICKLYVKSRI